MKWCFVRRSACLPAFLAVVFGLSPILGGSLPARATTIPHVLRFAAAEEIATLNPDLNQQLVVAWLDHHNALEPELATQVPTQGNGGVSKDGKTVTVHLRRGLKWSDGAPLDADDVVFSIAAEKNAANDIVDRSGFDRIAKVDEPDKQTVVVHTEVPIGAIVYRLFASNQTSSAILPKHLLGKLPNINTAPFNALPIGAGPFRYKAWERGDRVELEANPFYWRGRPALSQVVMKLIPDRNTVLTQLQTGELDMWYPFGGVFLSRVASIPNLHIVRQPSFATNLMLFNTTAPALTDRSVRQALRYAIDRRTIRDKIGHGVGILQNVLLPQVDPAVPKDIAFTPFDLAKANALLDASGWKRGDDGVRVKNGVRLSVDFASSQGTPDVDTQIEYIRAGWKEIGAEINVQRYQSSVLFGPYSAGGIASTGKFGALLLGNYIAAPFDLENAYGCSGIPPKGQNFNRFCYPPLEPLIAQYASSFDLDRRARILSKVLHVLDDQAISVVTIGREDLFGVSNAVKNFDPNNATPFDDMMHVDVVP